MPQMSPLKWLMLFMFFFTVFLMFNVLNYFSFFISKSTQKSNNKMLMNSFNWKW